MTERGPQATIGGVTTRGGIAVAVVAVLVNTVVYLAATFVLSGVSKCVPDVHAPNGFLVLGLAMAASLVAVLVVARLVGASTSLIAVLAVVQLPVSVGIAFLPFGIAIGSLADCR